MTNKGDDFLFSNFVSLSFQFCHFLSIAILAQLWARSTYSGAYTNQASVQVQLWSWFLLLIPLVRTRIINLQPYSVVLLAKKYFAAPCPSSHLGIFARRQSTPAHTLINHRYDAQFACQLLTAPDLSRFYSLLLLRRAVRFTSKYYFVNHCTPSLLCIASRV